MAKVAMKQDRRAKHNQGKCHTEGCENDAVIAGLCNPCYAYDYYWTRYKSAAERHAHAEKLVVRQNRMAGMTVRRTKKPKLRVVRGGRR